MRKTIALCILFACMTASQANAANNCSNAPGEGIKYCCNNPGEEWEQKTIEIVTNINLGLICHPGGSCTWSPLFQASSEVRWQIRSAIEEVNSASGVDLHLTMGGQTSASPGDEIDYKIHVYSIDNCKVGTLANGDFDGDGGWWWQDPWGGNRYLY